MYVDAPLKLFGSAPDREPSEQGTRWGETEGAVFSNGETVRPAADRKIWGIESDPFFAGARAVVFYQTPDGGVLAWCGVDGVWTFDGVAPPVQRFAWNASQARHFSAGEVNGFAYFASSDQVPVYWDGQAAACEPFPDWPSGMTANAIRAANNQLFAVGTYSPGVGRWIYWSDVAEPGVFPQSWTPAIGNRAGGLPFATEQVELLEVRAGLIAFGVGQIATLRETPTNGVYVRGELFPDSGCAAPGAAAVMASGRFAWLDSDRDLQVSDGVSRASVLSETALEAWRGAISNDQGGSAKLGYFDAERRLVVAAASAGSLADAPADVLLTYDEDSGEAGRREIAGGVWCFARGADLNTDPPPTWDDWATITWAELAGPWIASGGVAEDRLIYGTEGGVFELEGSASGLMPWRVRRTGLDFSGDGRWSRVRQILPRVTGAPGERLRVRVGSHVSSGGPVRWGDWDEWTLGADEPARHVDASGPFLALEFEAVEGQPFRLANMRVKRRVGGGRRARG